MIHDLLLIIMIKSSLIGNYFKEDNRDKIQYEFVDISSIPFPLDKCFRQITQHQKENIHSIYIRVSMYVFLIEVHSMSLCESTIRYLVYDINIHLNQFTKRIQLSFFLSFFLS